MAREKAVSGDDPENDLWPEAGQGGGAPVAALRSLIGATAPDDFGEFRVPFLPQPLALGREVFPVELLLFDLGGPVATEPKVRFSSPDSEMARRAGFSGG